MGRRSKAAFLNNDATGKLHRTCLHHAECEHPGPALPTEHKKYPQPRLCGQPKKAPTYFQKLPPCLRTPGQKGEKETAKKTEQERSEMG